MKIEKTLGHGEFMRQTSKNGSAPPSRIQSPSPAVAAAAAAYMAPNASDYPSSIGPPSYAVQQSAVPKGDVPVARSNTYTHTHADERWARAKIILGLTSISAAIAAVSLASILAAQVGRSNSVAQFIVPPSLVTLVWNIAELGRILLARGEGIVPGAHVGVRLVLWCAWLAVAIAFPLRNQLGNRSYWGYYDSWDTLSLVIAYMIVALCATVVFLEFALFARACVEENRRLKQKKATNAILHKAAALYVP